MLYFGFSVVSAKFKRKSVIIFIAIISKQNMQNITKENTFTN